MELPLDKYELGIKPELKILENKITLDYSIKGNDINYGKEQITINFGGILLPSKKLSGTPHYFGIKNS